MFSPAVVIINRRNGETLADRVWFARSLFSRVLGLIGHREFAEGSALVIRSCRQVHTCLVRFPIDVVFVDHDSRVVGIASSMMPWRVSRFHRDAFQAIELPAGTAERTDTRVGDILEIQ